MKAHEKELLAAVLVAHQRKDIQGCYCGWSKLGASHAWHIVEIYAAALGPGAQT